jgi:hypothetical protein
VLHARHGLAYGAARRSGTARTSQAAAALAGRCSPLFEKSGTKNFCSAGLWC